MMPLTMPRPDPDEPADSAFRLDPDTMTATVREQWMPLVRLATLLLNDRAVAEEVVQEACEATVWRRRPDVTSRAQLAAYLRTSRRQRQPIGRTAARNCRPPPLVDPGRSRHRPTPPPTPRYCCSTRTVARSAKRSSRLPDRQREVLVLRYWARLSEAEIAHTLEISTGTVKSTAHHALAAHAHPPEGKVMTEPENHPDTHLERHPRRCPRTPARCCAARIRAAHVLVAVRDSDGHLTAGRFRLPRRAVYAGSGLVGRSRRGCRRGRDTDRCHCDAQRSAGRRVEHAAGEHRPALGRELHHELPPQWCRPKTAPEAAARGRAPCDCRPATRH